LPAFSICPNNSLDSALLLASFLLPNIRKDYHRGLTFLGEVLGDS
jgi:hypothetical protein